MSSNAQTIYEQLQDIVERAHELERRFADELEAVHPNFSDSARNLLHYVALRQLDMRKLQDELASHGLSSLGRAEQHVLPTIRAVQAALARSAGMTVEDRDGEDVEYQRSQVRMDSHADALLGRDRIGRSVNIMVTLPTEAAHDHKLVRSMIEYGMDVARINCGHDDRDTWRRMVRHVRRANRELGSEVRIAMDLAGPKFRTGALVPGPRVVRIRRQRDSTGQTTGHRRFHLVPDDSDYLGMKPAVLPVPRKLIERAEDGDTLRFDDTRSRHRSLKVIGRDDVGLIVELRKTSWIATGTVLRHLRRRTGKTREFLVGELPQVEQPMVLRIGDTLVLHARAEPGEPGKAGDDGVVRPAHVSCTPVEVFGQVSAGDRVSLNDGKIEGIVDSADAEEIVVRITQAKITGSRLRSNRGINFPTSDLRLDGLTQTDRDNLPFIAKHADAVSLSFVREPGDVIQLQEALAELRRDDLAIIAKIETERAFRQLPEILLATMRNYPAGIMIARGDLAVECGWAQLAVMQEEILWMCEAAQVPVIWATQVLEGEAKRGMPTRAEITDAAMSQRADCVMLNKGPYIVAAIRMLDDILRKMQMHQHKKTARLPSLSISRQL